MDEVDEAGPWYEDLVKIEIVLHVTQDDAQRVALEIRDYIKRMKRVQNYSVFIVRRPEDEPE
jgi:hypothetical protein